MRLFMVMGIFWILEVISFLVAHNSLLFIVSDVWNCLQGVFIFVLFVMKRRVNRLIKERLVKLYWNKSSGFISSKQKKF